MCDDYGKQCASLSKEKKDYHMIQLFYFQVYIYLSPFSVAITE